MIKPTWLNKKINLSALRNIKNMLQDLSLTTVCQEASCPNISECFSAKVATFMILGDTCTRNCKFCGIKKGVPKQIDTKEATRIKEAVSRLGLKYVVVTSPTRDDLADGGAELFSKVVKELKSLSNKPKVEVLVPDFKGNEKNIEIVVSSSPEVIAHNLETVPSLYQFVRDGNYNRSLALLAKVKKINSNIMTKSGFMLGLGETKKEINEVLKQLIVVGCDFLTLGQYLPPTINSYSVKNYIRPEEFIFWERQAYQLGFRKVKSSPYVRSSYFADSFLGTCT